MIQTNYISFIGPKNCSYTHQGKNIAEFRLSRLRPIAKALKVDSNRTKNEVLKSIIAKLDALEAPDELTELLDG